tara:strand:- start:1285 stop:1677 length:393 start_codon:yes stop_codon:yes gene_type:complete
MKKVLSVILSFVFLITSMGFTVSSHICGGQREKTFVNIGRTDVSCDMKLNDVTKEIKSNCCQDEFQIVWLDENYTEQLPKVNLSIGFAIVPIEILSNLLPKTLTQKILYKNYLPPPLIRDIPVLVQSFLI